MRVFGALSGRRDRGGDLFQRRSGLLEVRGLLFGALRQVVGGLCDFGRSSVDGVRIGEDRGHRLFELLDRFVEIFLQLHVGRREVGEARGQVAMRQFREIVAEHAHDPRLFVSRHLAFGFGAGAFGVRGFARRRGFLLESAGAQALGLEHLDGLGHGADFVAAILALDFDREVAAGEFAHAALKARERARDGLRRHEQRRDHAQHAGGDREAEEQVGVEGDVVGRLGGARAGDVVDVLQHRRGLVEALVEDFVERLDEALRGVGAAHLGRGYRLLAEVLALVGQLAQFGELLRLAGQQFNGALQVLVDLLGRVGEVFFRILHGLRVVEEDRRAGRVVAHLLQARHGPRERDRGLRLVVEEIRIDRIDVAHLPAQEDHECHADHRQRERDARDLRGNSDVLETHTQSPHRRSPAPSSGGLES
jgi:hypothetical protein